MARFGFATATLSHRGDPRRAAEAYVEHMRSADR